MDEKKQKESALHSVKKSFSSRKFRQGAYATTLSAIVIVIILVINLFVQELDITADLTKDGKYSLAQETVDLIKGIKDDISIYYLVQSGSEIYEFQNIIDNFGKVEKNVKVIYKDPVQYPKFAKQYVDDDISEQSFLVVNDTTGKAKYVSQYDVIDYDYDYQTGQSTATGVSIENKIDAALQVVTNEKLPMVYATTGHGEAGISDVMSTLYKDSNIEHKNLNTVTAEEIPEDCDVLFINMPQFDFTQDEANLVLDYLKSGKKAVICVDFMSSTLPNFLSIMNYYGVNAVQGYVVEGDTNYFHGRYANELVPSVLSHEFTQGFKGDKYIVAPVATGLTTNSTLRDTLTFSEILKTSNKAYSKADYNSQVAEKEKNDIDGPFLLGVDVKETVGENETRLVVYSGKYIFDDQLLSIPNYGNGDLLLNTINKMTGQKNSLTVHTMSLSEDTLTMTSAQKNRNGVIVMAVIPLLFIVTGIVVVMRRRKK